MSMSIILGIILALIVFLIVVFLHELGHFLTARWSGVKVLEFWLWLPPRLKKLFKDKRGTEWTLNWLPIGWFVRLKWEDLLAAESLDPDALPSVVWWKQIIILLAGVTMNFLLAWVLFGFLFFSGTPALTVHISSLSPSSLLSHVGSGTQLIPIFDTLESAEMSQVIRRQPGVIVDPLVDSIAQKSGLMSGDIVSTIDTISLEKPEQLWEFLQANPGVHTLSILRGDESLSLSITPEQGKIGAYVSPNITLTVYKYGFWKSMGHGMIEVYDQIGLSFRMFGAMFHRVVWDDVTPEQRQEVVASVGGPIAIGRIFVDLARDGIDLRPILILTAMISLSLGVFNLLPFPALDGGRCLIVIVNQIIHVINPRFKITPKIEQLIHSAGFVLLIIFSILVTWKDIFLR